MTCTEVIEPVIRGWIYGEIGACISLAFVIFLIGVAIVGGIRESKQDYCSWR